MRLYAARSARRGNPGGSSGDGRWRMGPRGRSIPVTRPGDAVEQDAHRATEAAFKPGASASLRASGPAGADLAVAGDTAGDLAAHAGQGHSLPARERKFFEARYGHSFANVRVHHDQASADEADALEARAFTVGNHIYFGASQYRPGRGEGTALLGHELAHVAQQAAGAPMVARASFWEKLFAVASTDPITAYRASEIATESLAAAQATGLPGLHNGPADAWRHCYWNCRMAQTVGPMGAIMISS